MNVVLVASLTIAVGYFFWESRIAGDGRDPGAIAMIAVLPFRELSPDQDQAYFAEAMAEELLNSLSRPPDLKVAGRVSSFSFTADSPDLRAVGERLGVSQVLMGSVPQARPHTGLAAVTLPP